MVLGKKDKAAAPEKAEPGQDGPMSTGQLRDELQKGFRMFKAFEHADKLAEGVGQLEQAHKEAQVNAEKSRSDLQELEAKKQKAVDDIADADDKAAKILKDAKADAKEIVDKAKTEAKKLHDDAKGATDASAKDLDALNKKLAETQVLVDASQKQLDDLNAAKAKALESVTKALGE